MIKILQLTQTGGPGGAENVLLMLTLHLKDRFKMVVGLLKEGWLSQQVDAAGIPVRIVPSGKFIDLRLIFNLVKIIKEEKIDIVQSHLLDMNFYSSIASKISGIPHVATEHGDLHHPTKKIDMKARLKARILSILSNKIVFVSQFTENVFLNICRVSKNKIAIIYNGLDISEYEKTINKNAKKNALGIKYDEIVIGNVANLYPVKGQVYILRAAKQILSVFPKAIFMFIGRGSLEESLKSEARNLGIDNAVRFLGYRDDVPELLKIMDIFVLSSLSEAFPLSLVEAMASKIPVVATRVGGIPEIIDDGVSGFLILPADSDSIALKIINLLRDSNMANKMADCAYEKVKENFNLGLMLEKYEKIYSNLVRKH